MLLAIDQGNTSIKTGIEDEYGKLSDVRSFQSLQECLTYIKNLPIKYAIVSSVADAGQQTQLLNNVSSLFTVISLQPNTPSPLKNEYTWPEQLGSDRLADAVGAWSFFPYQHSLVIDCGTCINYEVVTNSGAYIGGGISPGLQMRLHSMHSGTGKLPMIKNVEFTGEFIGKSTQACMVNATTWGIIGEIEKMISNLESEYPQINVILTGGDALYFGKYLKNKIFAHPNLALTGLIEILKYNIEHSKNA